MTPPTPTPFVLTPDAAPTGVLTSVSSRVSQSLKSDEDAESTKEPQNELFEAQGNLWLQFHDVTNWSSKWRAIAGQGSVLGTTCFMYVTLIGSFS